MSNSVEDKVRAIFANPQAQAAAVEAIVRNRPKGWSRRSNAPYYKEHYAIPLKEELDKMIEDRQDRCYHYSDFAEMGISKESLYLRINQSLRYVLDYLDLDGKYKRFMEIVRIERRKGVGVELRFIEEFRNGKSAVVPRHVVPKTEAPKWKQEMDEWLAESSVGDKPFYKENLALTPDEIAGLKVMLAPLSTVMSSITSHSIKLIKVNADVA